MCNTLRQRIHPPLHSGEIVKDENANFHRPMPSTRWWCVSSRSFSNSHPRTQIEMDYREFIFMALLCHFCFCLAINLPKALLLPSLGSHSAFRGRGPCDLFPLHLLGFPIFFFFASRTHPATTRHREIMNLICHRRCCWSSSSEKRTRRNGISFSAWHLNGIFASFSFRLVSVNSDTVSSNVAVSIAIYFAHNKFVFICSGWRRTTMVAIFSRHESTASPKS